MITVVLFSLIPIEKSIDNNETYEFFIFFEEIQREIYLAEAVEVKGNALNIILHERTISYTKYTDYIRRRVNGSGHEKVLQHVIDFQIQIVNNQLQCEVTFRNGRKVSKKWFTVHELELTAE